MKSSFKMEFPSRIFVTGTDTGIGKSLVSAVLTLGLPNCGYWKPIQSGLQDVTDTHWVHKATGLPETRFFPETYKLKAPLSPHASAALENKVLNLDDIWVPYLGSLQHLVVEGAGGLMVPINQEHMMLDFIERLNYPVILAAKSGIGTINHTLLSLEQLRSRDLEVLGVVMSGPPNPSNKEAIEHFGKTPVIAQIDDMPEINPQALLKAFEAFA